jgi:hypothetical protein
MQAAPNTGIGDIALLYGYIRMLDPGSVVREGEITLTKEASSLAQRMLLVYNDLRKTEGKNTLAPEVRRDILDAAMRTWNAQKASYAPIAEHYRRMAGEYGYRPGNVVLPLFDEGQGGGNPPRVKVDAEGNIIP